MRPFTDEDYYHLWGDVVRYDALVFVQNQVQPVLMPGHTYYWWLDDSSLTTRDVEEPHRRN